MPRAFKEPQDPLDLGEQLEFRGLQELLVSKEQPAQQGPLVPLGRVIRAPQDQEALPDLPVTLASPAQPDLPVIRA